MPRSNQSIRSPDVVEIQDILVFTASAHATLGVAVAEDYNSVVTKIEKLIPNASEKAAFDAALSVPSATNPVVLKSDLTSYIPAADLGEVKDSVQNFTDLPATGNALGDLRPVISDNVIYRWNGTAWTQFIHTGTFDHTQLTNLNGDPAYQHVTLANLSTLNAQTHFHSNESVLDGITSVGSGQIITADERSRIPDQNEIDAMQGTAGFPSNTNRYVTNQDARLNTARNPYVTVGPPGSLATFTGVDAVPFEDALTALDTGSATAVKGIEVLPGVFNLIGSTLLWSNPAPLLVEAMAVGSVTLQVSKNGTQSGLQAMGSAGGPLTVRGVTFQINNYQSWGALTERPGTLFEDCSFVCSPLINSQVGVILNAPDCVVRRCTFSGQLLQGVQVNAPGCRVEECTFDLTNPQNVAVYVAPGADGALVDHNTFASGRVSLNASYAQVAHNFWNQASTASTVTIAPGDLSSHALVSPVGVFQTGDVVTFETTGALPAPLLPGHRYYMLAGGYISAASGGTPVVLTDTGSGSHTILGAQWVIDGGYSSRVVLNQPADFGQPLVGVSRTVGPLNSYADYRTDDETGFLAAFDDHPVVELQVLPGSYTFAKTVEIPEGCSVRGVSQGSEDVTVTGAGVTPFSISADNVTVENVFLGGSSTLISANSASGSVIRRCQFAVTGGSGYAVATSSCMDYRVEQCYFTGLYGVQMLSSLRGKVSDCYFDCSGQNLQMTSTSYDQIRDNFFVSAVEPEFGTAPGGACTNLIVEGNHFSIADTVNYAYVPTKVNTHNSVWQSNFPAPRANNIDGVDFIEVNLQGYLQPVAGLCEVSSIASVGSIEFDAVTESSANTQAVPIGAVMDTALAFTVELFWTSNGDLTTTKLPSQSQASVLWQVTAVFRDAQHGILGTATSIQQASQREGLLPSETDSVSFTFNNIGNFYTANPTHVSFTVTRLGNFPQDTLNATAHLLDAKVLLPRD